MTDAEYIEAYLAIGDFGNRIEIIGTLAFWGVKFDTGYFSKYTHTERDGEFLRLHFTDGEVLSIWSPSGHKIDRLVFRIQDASRIRWEWPYTDEMTVDPPRKFVPGSEINFWEFVKTADGISFSTNTDMFKTRETPRASVPALELIYAPQPKRRTASSK